MESRRNRRQVIYDEEPRKGKNGWKIIFLVSLVAMILIYGQVYILYKYTSGQDVTEKQMTLYKWVTSISSDNAEIVEETNIDIGVIGNILLSDKLQNSYIEDKQPLNSIFKYIEIKDYDLVIANLDMELTKNTKEIFQSLKGLNIALLNVATENMAYNNKEDIQQTLSNIKGNDIKYIGAKDNKNSYYLLEKNNIKIAIISYIDIEESNNYLNSYSSKKLEDDLKNIEKENVDGIILFIDTLRSNKREIAEYKKTMLKEILQKDIDVIISSDTVVQEIYTKQDNENNKKYIAYSLGDFIGKQNNKNSDISKLLKISINKNEKATFDVSFDKTFVALSNSDVTKCKIVNLDKEIMEYKEDVAGNISTAEYYYLLDIQKSENKN